MTKVPLQMVRTTALLLSLAGCGGSRWNAKDACATLPKEKVAAAAGVVVTSAQSGSAPVADRRETGSICTYALANGDFVGLLLRETPDGRSTERAIAERRSGGGVMPLASEVVGPGRAAFWSEEGKSLQVFYDARRYAAIIVPKPAPGRDPLKVARTIAQLLK